MPCANIHVLNIELLIEFFRSFLVVVAAVLSNNRDPTMNLKEHVLEELVGGTDARSK